MRKPEQNLWDTMRRNKPRGMKLERVENVLVDGMPDVHGLVNGVEFWVELKAPLVPKRPETKMFRNEAIRPAQVNWLLEHADLGGNGWILMRDSNLKLALFRGAHVMDIRNKTRRELEEFNVASDWPSIFARLSMPKGAL